MGDDPMPCDTLRRILSDARRRSLERVPRHRIPQMASDWALAHAGVHRERAA